MGSLPSVKSAGFTTLDLKDYQDNVIVTEKWRGKPIFVLKQSKEMLAKASAEAKKRLIEVNGGHYLVCVGLCTHLGCIPAFRPDTNDFKCACHGGEFDAAGEVTKSPPPSPLVIPPFKVSGTTLVLGEEGPEYQKLKADGEIA